MLLAGEMALYLRLAVEEGFIFLATDLPVFGKKTQAEFSLKVNGPCFKSVYGINRITNHPKKDSMKLLQQQFAAASQSKVLFVMIAGFAASLLLSMTMVSLVVRWLMHS